MDQLDQTVADFIVRRGHRGVPSGRGIWAHERESFDHRRVRIQAVGPHDRIEQSGNARVPSGSKGVEASESVGLVGARKAIDLSRQICRGMDLVIGELSQFIDQLQLFGFKGTRVGFDRRPGPRTGASEYSKGRRTVEFQSPDAIEPSGRFVPTADPGHQADGLCQFARSRRRIGP